MAKQVYSWNEVTDQQIADFVKGVGKLKNKLLPIDCDGDFPIDIFIIDRRKFRPWFFFPVPYNHHGEENEKTESLLITNLSYALDQLRIFLDTKLKAPKIKEDKSIGAVALQQSLHFRVPLQF